MSAKLERSLSVLALFLLAQACNSPAPPPTADENVEPPPPLVGVEGSDLPANEEPIRRAASLNQLAILEEEQGHFAAARALYEEALELTPREDDREIYLENLARLLLNQGELAAAETLLESVEQRRASLLAELAWLRLLQGSRREALRLIDEAMTLTVDRRTRAILHDRRGTVLERLGRTNEAAAAYHQALALRPPPAIAAATLINLCRLGVLHGRTEGIPGTEACRRAADAAGNTDLPSLSLASLYFWQAREYAARERLAEALATALRATSLVRRHDDENRDRRRPSRFLESRSSYLQLAVDLSMRLHTSRALSKFEWLAFATSESWRSRDLVDPCEPQEAFEAEAVQRLIDPQTMIFHLALGEARSWLWRLDENGIESFELPAAALLESQAKQFLELIAHPRNTFRRSSLLKVGASLTELLFGRGFERVQGHGNRLVFEGEGVFETFPIAALPIDASDPDRPRYLIEDYEVAHLPSLGLLKYLRQKKAAGASGGLALLGDPWYSAELLKKVPGLVEIPPTEARARLGPLPFFLARLPYSQLEVDLIRSHYRGPVSSLFLAQGPDANRNLALSGALAEYTILHFSAHGELNPGRPENAYLRLAEVDGHGRPVAGELGAEDIACQRWNAELVVASACNTAGGRAIRFAGIGGLSRGFFLAGSKRSLTSLWQVEGSATADLMDRFYAALLVGDQAPAAALRTAQRGLLDTARHDGTIRQAPYYWSGFVLVGDWKRFSPPHSIAIPTRSVAEGGVRTGRYLLRPTENNIG